MASFCGDDGILRIPATSPCRRDYQLRSSSRRESECDLSKPQSPWLPRSGLGSEEVSAFRLYESNPLGLDRSKYYSGPIPSVPQGVARSYYSGPLPSSPLPSYFGGPSPEVLPGFGTFEQRLNVSVYTEPEVGSRLREGTEASSVAGEEDEDVDEVRDVPYTSYLRNADKNCTPSSTNLGSVLGMQKQNASLRNCVSGELGINYEKSQFARRYKSGELAGLNIRADGIYPTSETRREVAARSLTDGKRQQSGSTASEALNHVKYESANSQVAMVAIPFKWEEGPGKVIDAARKPHSRTPSSNSTQSRKTLQRVVDTQVKSSRRFNGSSKKVSDVAQSERCCEVTESSDINLVAPSAASIFEAPSASSPNLTPEKDACSAVPFQWEEAPGKPKVEEKASLEATPALQLPPRLVKLNSVNGNAPASKSRSLSTASSRRVRSVTRTPSASESATSPIPKTSRNVREEAKSSPQLSQQPSPEEIKSRNTLSVAFLSGPLDKTARPSNFFTKKGSSQSGPISQFGLPQYQSSEFFCEGSNAWNSARSPTSTLCGPGSDGHSNPSSCSDKSSRKSPASVSFSNSHTSGTSAESFEAWSCGDHPSPTSRHLPESQGSSRSGSAKGPEESEICHGGTMGKLRRRLSSSSKPPISPINGKNASAPRPVDNNGYSSQGEFFDCQGGGSSPMPTKEIEPPTRLPYKMPSPSSQDVIVEPECASSKRAVPEFSNCLAFPRFLYKGAESVISADPPSLELPKAPSSCLEDGFRSPAYKATLELLSPSPNLMSKKSVSRSVKLGSLSSRRRHPHLVEVLCNSLKRTLQRCTKRSAVKTDSIVCNDEFSRRHQSLMW